MYCREVENRTRKMTAGLQQKSRRFDTTKSEPCRELQKWLNKRSQRTDIRTVVQAVQRIRRWFKNGVSLLAGNFQISTRAHLVFYETVEFVSSDILKLAGLSRHNLKSKTFRGIVLPVRALEYN